jgi:PTH1 family peptidyl-tRNA hydrolase
VLDAVLDRPTALEQALIDQAIQRTLQALPELLRGNAQRAMNRLHSDGGESAD